MKNKNYYPWVVVGLLWVVALLNYMDRQMLSTMQEAMKADIVELNKAEAFTKELKERGAKEWAKEEAAAKKKK